MRFISTNEVGGTVISIAPVVGLVGGGSAYAMAISVDSLGAMTLRGRAAPIGAQSADVVPWVVGRNTHRQGVF